MNKTLIDRMMKVGSLKDRVAIVSESEFFNERDYVQTGYPSIDIAFSGAVEGGMTSGLTVLAGESKSFKTLLGLVCMKAYLDKYKDAIAILYDSEFGITPEYLKSIGIPTDRILHIPILNIEELKFDMTQRLKEITKKDNVYILIDSLGNLASLKESQDAEDGKSVQDMSRAKQIKSFFRIITPHFTLKNIPCVVVNHVYDSQGLYAKKIVSGGQGVMLSANQVFIITKAQEKDGTDVAGWKFTINIEKSRYVKEKSKIPFTVMYDKGIQKWSFIFDLAQESGHIIKPKNGWYAYVNQETGEVSEPNLREKAVKEDNAFFENLLKDESFRDFVRNKFRLQSDMLDDTADIGEIIDLDEIDQYIDKPEDIE